MLHVLCNKQIGVVTVFLAAMSSSRSDVVILSVRPKPYFSFPQNRAMEPMELGKPTQPYLIKPIKPITPTNVPIHRSFPIPRRACFY